ncbi:transglycosylase SLT domain protein [Oceaniovalibus guishaninsula JLT2003]|uniref:Transglycosylase SLT domain protein n=1 Tax=Oceaniovalibus guishaninsula JLT2003 TaxID=1231392 RepID=K2HGA5_9RHOB|nr:transglycosylase SLT domain-containing protein [Oceaniovalibus guishaninsula]EKE45492.1 transglycosylase SLT domain protein [Oceaniovalibus guishaninsula JLT2003]
MRWGRLGHLAGAALLCAATACPAAGDIRPQPRPAAEPIPAARWDHRAESERWSRAVLHALDTHGKRLIEETPRDADEWCPGYADADRPQRRAFWVGFLSALAKHESTWKPKAVGGDGRWYGLLQILPATARGYGCRAGSGAELKSGAANLACAVRIMARTVPRDGVIDARSPRWSGVAADWGPLRSELKKADMIGWLRGQDYCTIAASPRPRLRPETQIVEGPRPASRPMRLAINEAAGDPT